MQDDAGRFQFNGNGATIQSTYHSTEQVVVAVPVEEIRDASSSGIEEVLQFSAGGVAGSRGFWLGLERFFTEGYQDPLFLVCIAFFLCGGVLSLTGFRQSFRRKRRLERYCPPDNKPA